MEMLVAGCLINSGIVRGDCFHANAIALFRRIGRLADDSTILWSLPAWYTRARPLA